MQKILLFSVGVLFSSLCWGQFGTMDPGYIPGPCDNVSGILADGTICQNGSEVGNCSSMSFPGCPGQAIPAPSSPVSTGNCHTPGSNCSGSGSVPVVVSPPPAPPSPTRTGGGTRTRTPSSTTSGGGTGKVNGPPSVFQQQCDGYGGTWNDSAQTCTVGPGKVCSQADFNQMLRDNTGPCGSGGTGSSPSTTPGGVCAQFQAQVEQCKQEADDALNSICNQNQNQGMTSTMAKIEQGVRMTSQFSSMNMQTACSELGGYLEAANGALLAFKVGCAVAQGNCDQSCKSVEAMIKANPEAMAACSAELAKVREGKTTCAKASNVLQGADQNLMAIAQQQMQSSRCASLTADLCKQNPSMSICPGGGSGNCADPSNMNKVCVCQRNPRDPTCGGGGGLPGSGSSGSGQAALDKATNDFLKNNPDGTGGGEFSSGFEELKNGANPQAGGPNGKGGGQGRNIGSGGDINGGGKGGAPGGGGGGKEAPRVVGGTYSAAGLQGSNQGGGGGQPGGGTYGSNKVNLPQFQKGLQVPKRGIAGASGPDGLTGQSTDIWQKVNSRYHVVSETMRK